MRNPRLKDSDFDYDEKIILNVGGVRHETWRSTLENIPGSRLSLLAKLQDADESYDINMGEYFFDRNPEAFNSILHFYRCQELHMDQNICGNVFREELTYWGIEEFDIEPCCWGVYSKYRDHKETLAALDDNFACPEEEAWVESESALKKFQKKVWRLLEHPTSSRVAKAITVISFLFVALSISIFVCETHYWFQVKDLGNNTYEAATDPSPPCPDAEYCCNRTRLTADEILQYKAHPVLMNLDYVCIAYFTFELLVRIIFCPDKVIFFKSVLNWIDIICLIPHYASVILRELDSDNGNKASAFLKAVMIMRIVRVLRIFKLMKHYSAFKILVYTIKVSTKELMLMVIFLFTGVLIFASSIYYAETENFTSIPIGFWWALVTMTTVGYGDKYPKGSFGYVIGSACVMCGVLVIAFTVPIVVNNFTMYYSHAQSRTKVPVNKTRSRKMSQRPKLVDVVPETQVCHVETETPRPNVSRDEYLRHNLNIKRQGSVEKENNINSKPFQVAPLSPDDNTRSRKFHIGTSSRRSRSEPRHRSPAPSSTSDANENQKSEAKSRNKIHEETRVLMEEMVDADRKLLEEKKRQNMKVIRERERRKELTKKEKKGKK